MACIFPRFLCGLLEGDTWQVGGMERLATASLGESVARFLFAVSLRVMTRIVIVGLYYKTKIVGFNPDSGIES